MTKTVATLVYLNQFSAAEQQRILQEIVNQTTIGQRHFKAILSRCPGSNKNLEFQNELRSAIAELLKQRAAQSHN